LKASAESKTDGTISAVVAPWRANSDSGPDLGARRPALN
jgi:hypothetical protein